MSQYSKITTTCRNEHHVLAKTPCRRASPTSAGPASASITARGSHSTNSEHCRVAAGSCLLLARFVNWWKQRQWLSAGLAEHVAKLQDGTNWEKPGWRHLLQTRPLRACQHSPHTLTCHRTALKSSPSSPWASTVGKGLISHLCLLLCFFQYCSCTNGAKNTPTTRCFFPKGCLPSLVANSPRNSLWQLLMPTYRFRSFCLTLHYILPAAIHLLKSPSSSPTGNETLGWNNQMQSAEDWRGGHSPQSTGRGLVSCADPRLWAGAPLSLGNVQGGCTQPINMLHPSKAYSLPSSLLPPLCYKWLSDVSPALPDTFKRGLWVCLQKKTIWWDALKAKQMLAGSCSSGECDSSLAQSKELQKWHFEVSPQKMSLKYIKEQKSPEHFPS